MLQRRGANLPQQAFPKRPQKPSVTWGSRPSAGKFGIRPLVFVVCAKVSHVPNPKLTSPDGLVTDILTNLKVWIKAWYQEGLPKITHRIKGHISVPTSGWDSLPGLHLPGFCLWLTSMAKARPSALLRSFVLYGCMCFRDITLVIYVSKGNQTKESTIFGMPYFVTYRAGTPDAFTYPPHPLPLSSWAARRPWLVTCLGAEPMEG